MGPRVPLLLLLSMLATCESPGESAPATAPSECASAPLTAAPSANYAPAPPVPIRRREPSVDAKRAEHFGAATAMRAALVRDDLAGFRASASRLGDRDLSSARRNETWRPHLPAMRVAAQGARDARSLKSGAKALTDVARACASCHETLGVPDAELDALPTESLRPASSMLRHAWAAERLWDGLSLPSEVAWATGADVFAKAPLEPAEIGGPRHLARDIGKVADRAHAYGTQGATATDAPARAKVLSDAFETCIECHAKLQIGKGI